MKKKIFKTIIVILVNLFLTALFIFIFELSYRKIQSSDNNINPNKIITGLDVYVKPYFMWTSAATTGDDNYMRSQFSNKEFKVKQKPNNYDFLNEEDFTMYPRKYEKEEDEKTILITGGSAVHGCGASSNETTLAYLLEEFLNEVQLINNYKVINLGMGAFNAYQQFIVLDLFGRRYNPDWVITMDGRNDANSFVPQGAGVGNPCFWPNMKFYLDDKKIVNKFEAFFIHHSSIYRSISGLDPSQIDLSEWNTSKGYSDHRFNIRYDRPWIDIEKHLQFYISSEEAVLTHFQDAKVILSTQPYAQGNGKDYTSYYSAKSSEDRQLYKKRVYEKLNQIFEDHRDKMLSEVTLQEDTESSRYFMMKSGFILEDMAHYYQETKTRNTIYLNPEVCFGVDDEIRTNYFMDQCHMMDNGQEILALYYAIHILKSDFIGESKGYIETLKEKMQALVESTEGTQRMLPDIIFDNNYNVLKENNNQKKKNFNYAAWEKKYDNE